ncbi:PTS sugar transporter subunit IIA [Pectinatus haikarae]|uniref:PTS system galactitol-specific IIA component n=1 Tax=Pectinatus haikarae TaxID=349096 RepID=A0ABT9YD29_9FIRM|nr:PTS sugar transporter subunit IIA [Pectinatus haikarae]MDQ0205092.1 PTS system galactitol-specific IIA component [Pectinatus haikarae]
MSDNQYLVIEGSAKNAEDAINICGEVLYKAGIVGREFGKKCWIRECNYPTGLPTVIPVAIPHCKDDEIKKNAICILRLTNPVIFRRMDDDQEIIETKLIINLAIKESQNHLKILQNLMTFLNDEEQVSTCQSMSANELIVHLTKRIG